MTEVYSGNKPLKCPPNKARKPFVPQPHQSRVAKEFLETSERGLLFYHALGSGKTCAAYLGVDMYRATRGKRKVIILSPAALASSHQHQYCNVCGEHPFEFSYDFLFYSYNDRQGIMAKIPDLSGCIVIIDEVQEVINGKYNGSKTLSYVYDQVLSAVNIKLILLSGTPIFQPEGAGLILNLLKPGKVPSTEMFMEQMKDPDYLFRLFRGVISHVPVPDPSLYPTRVEPNIEDWIPMSKYQYSIYFHAREGEKEPQKGMEEKIKTALRRGNLKLANMLKAQLFIQMTKLKSRQVCNFAYPAELLNPDKQPTHTSDKDARWLLDDEQFIHVANLATYSPKMNKLIGRLLTLPGKHMVYGWFKSHYGLYLIQAYLKHCGITSVLFSGDLSDKQRGPVIDAFNAEDNKRGEKQKVILVSGAGAMGISILGIRHFHNFEAGINEFISVQAEGRAFRTFSHHQLPPEERNVQVYRYFSVLPKLDLEDKLKLGETKSTEEMMYEKGVEKMRETEYVLSMMRRASFDCREPYNRAITDCYDYDQFVVQNRDGEYDFAGMGGGFEERGGERKAEARIEENVGEDEIPGAMRDIFSLSKDEILEVLERKGEESTFLQQAATYLGVMDARDNDQQRLKWLKWFVNEYSPTDAPQYDSADQQSSDAHLRVFLSSRGVNVFGMSREEMLKRVREISDENENSPQYDPREEEMRTLFSLPQKEILKKVKQFYSREQTDYLEQVAEYLGVMDPEADNDDDEMLESITQFVKRYYPTDNPGGPVSEKASDDQLQVFLSSRGVNVFGLRRRAMLTKVKEMGGGKNDLLPFSLREEHKEPMSTPLFDAIKQGDILAVQQLYPRSLLPLMDKEGEYLDDAATSQFQQFLFLALEYSHPHVFSYLIGLVPEEVVTDMARENMDAVEMKDPSKLGSFLDSLNDYQVFLGISQENLVRGLTPENVARYQEKLEMKFENFVHYLNEGKLSLDPQSTDYRYSRLIPSEYLASIISNYEFSVHSAKFLLQTHPDLEGRFEIQVNDRVVSSSELLANEYEKGMTVTFA